MKIYITRNGDKKEIGETVETLDGITVNQEKEGCASFASVVKLFSPHEKKPDEIEFIIHTKEGGMLDDKKRGND